MLAVFEDNDVWRGVEQGLEHALLLLAISLYGSQQFRLAVGLLPAAIHKAPVQQGIAHHQRHGR